MGSLNDAQKGALVRTAAVPALCAEFLLQEEKVIRQMFIVEGPIGNDLLRVH